jgi:superoxide dismutase, Cu-Zn family
MNGGRACAAIGVVALLGAGCALTRLAPAGAVATAEVRDAAGRVVGQATLTEVSGGVRIVLEVRGLTPGPKGVHLHGVGTCEGPAFASAGEHFNPRNAQHGLLNPAGPHAGDLPNVTVDPDGKGRLETFTERVTLGPGSTSLLDADGTALVVHADADDFRTDPSGNTGARIACGVVEKPPPKP